MLCLVVQSCCTFCDPMDCSPPGSSSMGFSWQECGVGCLALLQGIFPTQGSNPGLPHCRWILYHLSHQGSLYTFSIEVQLMYNVVLISAVQQRDLVIYTHTFFFIFFFIFPLWLSQDIKYCSLCYKVGPYCLSVLNLKKFFIYLAVLGLCLGMWGRQSLLQPEGSFVATCRLLVATCVQLPGQGLNLGPLLWECRVVAAELPGVSCVHSEWKSSPLLIFRSLHPSSPQLPLGSHKSVILPVSWVGSFVSYPHINDVMWYCLSLTSLVPSKSLQWHYFILFMAE